MRIVALEDSRELASQLYPHVEPKSRQQMLAYLELTDAQLFREQWVKMKVDASELPGTRGARMACPQCGEGVNSGRFAEVDGERLCLSCARPELRYWEPENSDH